MKRFLLLLAVSILLLTPCASAEDQTADLVFAPETADARAARNPDSPTIGELR